MKDWEETVAKPSVVGSGIFVPFGYSATPRFLTLSAGGHLSRGACRVYLPGKNSKRCDP